MVEDIENDDHEIALTINNKEIHITQAESGKNGYYCKYCGHEMVAKKGKLNLRRPHFAHDSKQKVFEGKCIFSNETYRHKVAKEILQRLMKIRVPMVVKYPPNGIEGIPYMLQPARTIKAHSVSIEMPFYEDENGAIRHGKNVDLSAGSGRNLLIQPDVTFFDANGYPILFIEIVATHKPDIDKFLKARKLGIDMVQVSIPKDIEEEIEKTFSHIERTKWVFNYEQEKTEYVRPSERSGERIPPFGDFEAKLLKESETFNCRKFAVSEFIRRIRKFMASSEFREFEEGLVEEIRLVERNTERHQNEWSALQDELGRDVRDEFAYQESEIAREEEGFRREEGFFESEEREFEGIQRKFTAESSNLERRYIDKRRELEDIQRDYRAECQDEIDGIERDLLAIGSEPRTHRERLESIGREEESWDSNHRSAIDRIKEDSRAEIGIIAEIEARRATLPEKYRGVETELRPEFERKKESFERYFEQRKSGIGEEFERNRRESTLAVEARDSSRVSRIQGRLRNISETRNKLYTLRERKITHTRLRKFKELFDQGAYKNWT